MSSWKLGRRQAVCLRCQRPFGEGEAHYSILDLEGDRLLRLDLCHACWPAEQAARGSQGDSAAWWRSRRPLSEKRGLSVDLEGLEALFHALAERPQARLLELRYVLALLLLRKRRLFLVRATVKSLGPGSEGRGEFLVLRRPRRKEEEFLVQVFDFGPERMESLRADLERLFEGAGLEDFEAGSAENAGAEESPANNGAEQSSRPADQSAVLEPSSDAE